MLLMWTCSLLIFLTN